MATYEYIIRNGNCDSTNYDHFHHGVVKTINDTVANQIPKNAVVSKVRVYLNANFDSVFGTIGQSDLYMLFGSSTEATSGDTFYSGVLTSDSKDHFAEITSKVSLTHPFSINTSYAYIVLYHDSTTRRKYHCDLWKIIYDYSIPTYTLTVTAGTGGTVSGGGTYNNQATATLKATPNTGYKFVKWSDGNTLATRTVTVTGNATYTATFEKLKYTVTWKNGDTVLETDTGVPYGTTPTYNGSTPTKASTAQYSYTFSGWSPSVGAITGNVTYTAQFTQTLRSYAVTFKDENGTTLKTETVGYGSKPTPPSNPTKADTAQWDYTFDGWYDANGNKWTSSTTITGATTFTARYTAVVQKYIVRWFNYDGTLLETDTDVPYGTKPTYNGSTPTKAGNAEHSYQFAGWNYDTENGITPSLGTTYIDITAQFTEIDNTYTVEWVNEGKVIETDTLVPYGAKPDYDEVKNGIPTKASDAQYDYTFIGWSTSVSNPAKPESELETVKGNVTYTAVYSATLKLYPIKIILFDTESTQVVEYGTDIVIEAPAVIGYKFVQWDDGNTDNPRTVKVTGEATYQAVYEKIPFPIMVNNEQVTGVYIVPSTQTIVYVISGEVPVVEANEVTVDGWSFEVSNSVPNNSYLLEKLYINETRVY